ncbi:hypothetical protein GALL_298630 [mine drainage metagenome]|uniref:Uncharacterized protein n=1 Tax=mine drainage metagenome TaxID=410659 RepID=A0A1J5QX24_9ZZZZ
MAHKHLEGQDDASTDAEKWTADQVAEPASAAAEPDAPDVTTDAEKWRADSLD